ncbi:hypothetical protein BDV97DRAFT_399693 [Delphinella strobiligena]|nr:hypothetical protein BDV97DRAFT_399693 [Delphinella strobiligena]
MSLDSTMYTSFQRTDRVQYKLQTWLYCRDPKAGDKYAKSACSAEGYKAIPASIIDNLTATAIADLDVLTPAVYPPTDTITEPVRFSEDLFRSGFRTISDWNHAVNTHAAYGCVLTGFWVLVVVVGMTSRLMASLTQNDTIDHDAQHHEGIASVSVTKLQNLRLWFRRVISTPATFSKDSRLRDRVRKSSSETASLRLLLEGPYGTALHLSQYNKIVFIVGGTGITIALSYLCQLYSQSVKNGQQVHIIWSIRQAGMLDAVMHQQNLALYLAYFRHGQLNMQIYNTSGSHVPVPRRKRYKPQRNLDHRLRKTPSRPRLPLHLSMARKNPRFEPPRTRPPM